MAKNISLIVAMANQNVIGINNTLPWHLPEDLKQFKALTMGHHIIMGRKTYESLGRLLPGRTTVIVTRDANYQVEGALIANNLTQALDLCADDEQPFIIGGAELYQLSLPVVNTIYLTKVYGDYAGDTFFPALKPTDWQLISDLKQISATGIAFSYQTYQRVFTA